jgi:hypothetical protein
MAQRGFTEQMKADQAANKTTYNVADSGGLQFMI